MGKGVLLLALQARWTMWTQFCFIKYDTCELASVPAVLGTYQVLPSHEGGFLSPAAVTQEKAKASTSSALLVWSQH